MQTYLDDTCFLFATPSFLRGMAQAIDIGGTLVEYNISRNQVDADSRALASDWAITGKDIQNAIERETTQETKEAKKQAR